MLDGKQLLESGKQAAFAHAASPAREATAESSVSSAM
jgi:hypothetical protein